MDFLTFAKERFSRDLNHANTITCLNLKVFFFLRSLISFYICFSETHRLFIFFFTLSHTCKAYVHHISSILVVHDTLVLTMCHFFWSPLTLQDTSYSPEPHISAEHSQSLLSAQEAVSLWVLGTRKVCILIRLSRDAIFHFLTPVNVAFLHIICTDLLSVFYYIKN